MVSFEEQKFNFDEINFINFFSNGYSFWCPKNFLPTLSHKNTFAFFLISFIIL